MTADQAVLADAEAAAPTATGSVVTFYSYKGGTGRTMALANLGWILASQGLRVLVVDWDLEAPGLHRYFHPLLVDPELRDSDGLIDLLRAYVDQALPTAGAPPAAGPRAWLTAPGRLDRYLCGLALDLPAGGRLDLMPAGRQNDAYSAAVTSFNWRSFYTRADVRGAEFLAVLRERWTASYDYVLIDSRTGVSDTSGICTVLMPDTVVDCFTLGAQSIRGGVDAARAIARADERDIRVLPVPMRVEETERAGLAAGRELAHEAFAPYLDRWLGAERRDAYWRDVEVPYKPFYAYEEVPATVVDRPRQQRSLLGAFERLADWLTEGRVRELHPVPDRARRRLYAAYLRPGRTRSRQVRVSYAPGDRMWAEWAAATLTGFGYLAALHGAAVRLDEGGELPEAAGPLEGEGRVLALLSPEYLALPRARALWRRLGGADGALLAVAPQSLPGPLPEPFDGHPVLDLAGADAEQAQARLFELLGPPPGAGRWVGAEEEPPPPPARFPTERPAVHALPPREPAFTGRGPLLDRLRDGFTLGPPAGSPAGASARSRQVLYGMGGVGKSQTAAEYAHRSAPGYDLVWWIRAEQPADVPQQLADLAAALGLPAEEDVQRAARDLLHRLDRGEPYRRWLLVYDNAEDPAGLEPWLPTGTADGHVLVTSRDRRWARHPGCVEVEVFDRAESVRLIRRFNTALPDAEAGRIAELLGDLPLALGQAARWLQETPMPAATYLHLLGDALAEVLDRSVPGDAEYSGAAAATARIAGADLRRINAPAMRLLELCGFLGPDAIPIELFYGEPALRALGLTGRPGENRIAVGEILRTVNQYGLARYDAEGGGTLGVHRIVQALLREQVAPAERPGVLAAVHGALALAGAGDPDRRADWPRFAALLPHLGPSGAVASHDPAVRRWITASVRYLRQRGLSDAARDLAERALVQWCGNGDSADPEDELPTLLLRIEYGNVLRQQGAAQEAYRTDREVWERLTTVLGPDHLHTVTAAGGLGGDLRQLGRYTEAQNLDRQTLAHAEQALGPDHPRTTMLVNNLAVSELLAGDLDRATALHREALARQRALLGDDSLYTLSTVVNLARDLREAGRVAQAYAHLAEAVGQYRELFGADHDGTLRALRDLGATLLRLGRPEEARAADEEAHRRLLARYGADHPHTAAAAGNLAADLVALGEPGPAVEPARGVFEYHRAHLGEEYPTTLLAAGNLAVALRAAGRTAEAAELSGRALDGLRARLGERHRYVGAALLNHANSLAAAGDAAGARALDEQAAAVLARALGADHPDALAAEANLALSRAAAGEPAGEPAAAAELLRRAGQALGEGHPVPAAIRAARRLDVTVEAPPV
ncbi:FxSxx-COOH system tetratricopeptide repeat protein [Kitasatospora sp. NPDC097643]|uniref:FxSxx-COOH system tetratricopeptide repeat protein n=1 Tax=Kitasatospora sp. NPDC097643 TaxID=3157230 RepID=UPI00332D61F1